MSLRTQKLQSLAEELVLEGIINNEQLIRALEEHHSKKEDLGDIMIRQGFLSESVFNQRLALKAGVPVVSLNELNLGAQLFKILHPEQARRWQIVPIFENGDKLIVATSDPFDFEILDEIRSELGREVNFALASRQEIRKLLELNYIKTPEVNALLLNASDFVDNLLEMAFRERASDIHIEPMRDSVEIRFRIDGILEHRKTISFQQHQSVLSRIKILGGMDVAEHRLAQDGRMRRKIADVNLDIRIVCYPTICGESAAIRLFSKENLVTLEDMGLSAKDQETFKDLIKKPHGIFLVTGPTGSGKTTSLYTALQNLNRKEKHVLTVEDPVENEIELTSQTQVNIKAGLTFASVLRSMLREDPDIIMVGEIRDEETAEISCRSAMTGHLVLSTLHTNTAVGAISRLVDLGLPPYLISSTLTGVMAQRLVRKICPACRIECPTVKSIKNYKGKGCSACEGKGYKGRIGIYELIPIDDEFRQLINTKAPEIRLRERASFAGGKTIFEDGLNKVSQGITTLEEIYRVCDSTL